MNLESISNKVTYQKQLDILEKEKNYRKNENLNFSAIKDFDEAGPFEYYKKHIAKDRVIKTESEAFDIGNLVDCLLTVPDTFDSRFYTFSGDVPVIGQNRELVEEMFRIIKGSYDEGTDSFTMGFEDVFTTAFENIQLDKFTKEQVKFKGKTWQTVLDIFADGPMEDYYNTLMSNINRRGVGLSQVEMAEAIVKSIQSVPVIQNIYNGIDPNVEVSNQFPIYFEYKGFKMKGLLDTLFINHKHKTVQDIDLKTSWSTIDFEYNRIKQRYYLQEAVYYTGLKILYPDYKVLPRRYIIADSKNHIRPYIAKTTEEHVSQGINGFTTPSGMVRKGLDQLLDELKWHFDNSTWNTTKEIYENNDEITLKLFA